MKIRRLDLIAFGPFTDLSLDLSAGPPGLHLIHGPNEAGKSSALRAIHDLFYGIGARTGDNFLHDYNRLRIGATIEDRLGNVLEFRRRKGSKGTLLASDDETPLAPEALDRFLGGVDSEAFRSLFGIDHHRLIEGGRAILEGRGQVGQLLFAAGSGLTGLRAATEAIQGELDDLFKPRGQNPEINKQLGELGDLRKVVQEHQLPGEEWTGHNAARLKAIERKEALDHDRQERSRERNRLLRIRNALKPIGERDELQVRLDGFQDAVPLSGDFTDRHRSARESLTRALALAEQAELDLQSSEEQLGQVAPPDDLLAEAEAIESLYRRLGAYLKGQEDRPNRHSEASSDEHFARDLLVQLGKPRDLEEAEALLLRGDEPEVIRELGRRRASLDANLEGSRADLASHEARLKELEADLDALGPDLDVEPLRRVVNRSRKLGDPEATLALGFTDREEEARSLRETLARLPHWTGSIDDLTRLTVPLDETIAEAARSLVEFEQRIVRTDHNLASVSNDIDAIEAEIQALQLEREVPTEADLADSRHRRNEGWHLVRLAWLDQAGPSEVSDGFIAEFTPGRHLADAFERSLSRADDLADRLRREADRVASLVDRVAQRERHVRRRDELRRTREADEERLREQRSAWADRLRSLGLPELGPEELRAWLKCRAELVEASDTLRRRDREHEQLTRTIAEHRASIAAGLRDAGQPEGPDTESLADRVERTDAFIKAVGERQTSRKELNKALERTQWERDEAQRRLRETNEQRDAWQTEWSARMARLGLEANASTAQAESFLQRIDRLFNHIEKARSTRARIKGIDRDAQRFADDVKALALSVAPDLTDRLPEAAVPELYRRLASARDLRKERETLVGNRDAAQRKLHSAREMIAQDRARLGLLCREAQCGSPDELPAAEAAASERARIEAELRRIEDQIRDSSAGSPLDAFIVEALALDPDTIELRIDELEEKLEAIEEERSRLDQAIGREDEWLRSQKGGDEAASAAERTQSLLAELRARVEDYAALRIAAELLQRGIEQFREENQGPILRRASELFASLTGGSFQGLLLDEDDRGEPLLVGLRDDRHVGVEAMSDGSCDQLYLALRLASLEGWLARHEPIPLIADDILLNFDDERSAAALLALAELSHHTQVLFFTHHDHLIDLARDRLPVDLVFVHRLVRTGPTLATPGLGAAPSWWGGGEEANGR